MGAALGNRELQRERRREELLNAPASFLSRWPLPLHLPVFSSFLFLSSPPPFFFLFSSFLRYFGRALNAPAFPSAASRLRLWSTRRSVLACICSVITRLHRCFSRGSMSNRRRKWNRFISRFNSAEWSNFAIDLSGCAHKIVPYPRGNSRFLLARRNEL